MVVQNCSPPWTFQPFCGWGRVHCCLQHEGAAVWVGCRIGRSGAGRRPQQAALLATRVVHGRVECHCHAPGRPGLRLGLQQPALPNLHLPATPSARGHACRRRKRGRRGRELGEQILAARAAMKRARRDIEQRR